MHWCATASAVIPDCSVSFYSNPSDEKEYSPDWSEKYT